MDVPTQESTGGCCCGAIRYVITGTPEHALVCHCPDCRRAAGAHSVAWLILPKDNFKICHATEPQHSTREGFDVVTYSVQTSAECSPLSCNGLAKDVCVADVSVADVCVADVSVPDVCVNEHCLFATFEEAKGALESGLFDRVGHHIKALSG